MDGVKVNELSIAKRRGYGCYFLKEKMTIVHGVGEKRPSSRDI
jgi:hypothetical protein